MSQAAAPSLQATSRSAAWLPAAALLAVWIAALGAVPLFDVDEGAFAEASREMLASGDWGHTTLNGADRFDKPILVYWLQAAAMALFGPGEFAARLPSALCAWGWCLAVARFARPRWGEPAALGAALLTATAIGPALIGRAATADALLNLLLTLAGLALWRTIEGGQRRDLWLAAVWIGLGWLAKGPVALLVPGGALLTWAVVSRQWATLVRLLGDWRAWALMLALALPWYLYALMRHGQAFIDGFFVRHNLERFGGPMEGHGGSLLYYLLALPLLLAPWSPLLLGALGGGMCRMWQSPLSRFLLCWLGFVLVFFSLSGTKLPHYALYGATPAVLLALPALPRHWAPAAVALPSLLLVLAGPASPWLAQALATRAGPAMAESVVTSAPSLAVAMAAGLAILALLWPWPRLGPLARTLAMTAVASGTFLAQTLPWWAQQLQAPVRALGQQMQGRPEPLVQWRVHQPSFAYYAGRSAPRRAPVAGEVALIRRDRLRDGEAASVRIVAAQGPWLLVTPP